MQYIYHYVINDEHNYVINFKYTYVQLDFGENENILLWPVKYPKISVGNSNKISWTFLKYVCTTELSKILENYSKTGNLPYYKVVWLNEVIAYERPYVNHG